MSEEDPRKTLWWYIKQPYVWITATVVSLALVLTNINTILREVRETPEEYRKTSSQFFNWWYEYDQWPGRWTSDAQGYVDLASLHLGPMTTELNLDVMNDGTLTGVIETQSICDGVPYFEELMILGTITGANSADLELYAYVDGRRLTYATLRAQRDDYFMTLMPRHDQMNLFAEETRIAKNPDDYIGEVEGSPLCPEKSFNFIMDAYKEHEANKSE